MSLVHLVDPPMSLDFLVFFAYSLILSTIMEVLKLIDCEQ